MESSALQEEGSADYGSLLQEQQAPPPLPPPRRPSRRSSSAEIVLEQVTLAWVKTVEKTLPFDDSQSNCKGCCVHAFEGRATLWSEIAGVSKNLIGGGVLSLAGGIALFSNDIHGSNATVAAVALIWLLGAVFAYFTLLLAKVCQWTGAASYRECWDKSKAPRAGSILVALVNTPKLSLLSYNTILAQAVQSLAETAQMPFEVTHVQALLLVTICGTLPLCLLKNLNVLAPFSAMGLGGIIFTAVVMVLRCVDGSYQPGGRFYEEMNDTPQLQPFFGTYNAPLSVSVLPFCNMIFQSFVMHYNAPRFFTELHDATLPRFATVVGVSFGLAAVLYTTMALAGFYTFGGNTQSNVLSNYSPHDGLASISRFTVAFSTLATYPIVFMAFRDAILDLLQLPPHKIVDKNLNRLTIVLVVAISVVSVRIQDLGMISAISGGTIATALVFIFPTFMFEGASRARMVCCPSDRPWRQQMPLVYGFTIVGVVLGAIGVCISVQKEMSK